MRSCDEKQNDIDGDSVGDHGRDYGMCLAFVFDKDASRLRSDTEGAVILPYEVRRGLTWKKYMTEV